MFKTLFSTLLAVYAFFHTSTSMAVSACEWVVATERILEKTYPEMTEPVYELMMEMGDYLEIVQSRPKAATRKQTNEDTVHAAEIANDAIHLLASQSAARAHAKRTGLTLIDPVIEKMVLNHVIAEQVLALLPFPRPTTDHLRIARTDLLVQNPALPATHQIGYQKGEPLATALPKRQYPPESKLALLLENYVSVEAKRDEMEMLPPANDNASYKPIGFSHFGRGKNDISYDEAPALSSVPAESLGFIGFIKPTKQETSHNVDAQPNFEIGQFDIVNDKQDIGF